MSPISLTNQSHHARRMARPTNFISRVCDSAAVVHEAIGTLALTMLTWFASVDDINYVIPIDFERESKQEATRRGLTFSTDPDSFPAT